MLSPGRQCQNWLEFSDTQLVCKDHLVFGHWGITLHIGIGIRNPKRLSHCQPLSKKVFWYLALNRMKIVRLMNYKERKKEENQARERRSKKCTNHWDKCNCYDFNMIFGTKPPGSRSKRKCVQWSSSCYQKKGKYSDFGERKKSHVRPYIETPSFCSFP